MDKNIPLFEIVFDEENDDLGIMAMGLVDNPAIESNVVKFSNVKVENFVADEAKKQITGAYMIPDKQMLRQDTHGNLYKIFFNTNTIEKYANKMFKNKTHDFTTLNHNEETLSENNYVIEHWIKKHKEFDKSYFLDIDAPVGSAFITYQLDDDTFQKYVDGELNGLSIELYTSPDNYKYMSENKNNNEKMNKIDKKESKLVRFYNMVEDFFTLKNDTILDENTENIEKMGENEGVSQTGGDNNVDDGSVDDSSNDSGSVVQHDLNEDSKNYSYDDIKGLLDDYLNKINDLTQDVKGLKNENNELKTKVGEVDSKVGEVDSKVDKKPASNPIQTKEPVHEKVEDMSLSDQIYYKLNKYKDDIF